MVPSSYLSSSAGEPINMSLLVIYLWLALVAIMVVITVICFKYKRPVNRPLTCSLVRLAFRSSVLLRWLCDTFCTSGFMNNAMFVHNGREGDAKQTYTQSDSTGAARIWHRGVYSDWPTRGSTGAGAEYAICAIALCLQLEAASHRCISRLCCRHRRSVGVDEGNTLLSHSLVWHHIMYVQLPQLMMPWQLDSDTSRLGTCVNNVTRVAVHLSRLSATPLDTACTSHAHLQTYQLVTSARAAIPRAQRDNVACCYRPTGVVCLSVFWPRPWALQKRLNRSKCRVGADLHGPRNYMLDWAWVLQRKGAPAEIVPGNPSTMGESNLRAYRAGTTTSTQQSHHPAMMRTIATITVASCYYLHSRFNEMLSQVYSDTANGVIRFFFFLGEICSCIFHFPFRMESGKKWKTDSRRSSPVQFSSCAVNEPLVREIVFRRAMAMVKRCTVAPRISFTNFCYIATDKVSLTTADVVT